MTTSIWATVTARSPNRDAPAVIPGVQGHDLLTAPLLKTHGWAPTSNSPTCLVLRLAYQGYEA